MKLIVGLGNPGNEYNNTRHNIGFIIIDFFANYHGVEINKKKFNGLYGEFLFNNEKLNTALDACRKVIRKIVDGIKNLAKAIKNFLTHQKPSVKQLYMLRLRPKSLDMYLLKRI